VSARAKRGLTLIELLVVMGIIIFLSAFLIAHLAPAANLQAKNSATRALIAQTELALGAYRSEMGAFPPDLQTLMKQRTKTITIGSDPNDPRSVREVTFPPFLVLAKEQISADGKDILDAWGDPLHYDATRSKGLVWSDNLPGP